MFPLKRYSKLITGFFQDLFSRRDHPYVYVALGDSTVEGIGASHPSRSYTGLLHASLKEIKRKVVYYNLGKSGAVIADVVAGQLTQTLEYQPDLITISIGANDVYKRTKLSDFERDLNTLLETLKKETSAEIVINTIPDLSLTPKIPKAIKQVAHLLTVRFNKKIIQLASTYGVILVDIFTQSKIYAKNYPEALSADGFHPSDFGYAVWANTIMTHIQQILFSQKTL